MKLQQALLTLGQSTKQCELVSLPWSSVSFWSFVTLILNSFLQWLCQVDIPPLIVRTEELFGHQPISLPEKDNQISLDNLNLISCQVWRIQGL